MCLLASIKLSYEMCMPMLYVQLTADQGHPFVDEEGPIPVLQAQSINQDAGLGPVLVRRCQEEGGLIPDLHHHLHGTDVTPGHIPPAPGEGESHLVLMLGGMSCDILSKYMYMYNLVQQ